MSTVRARRSARTAVGRPTSETLRVRLAWFVLLWAASVLALAALAWPIRCLLKAV